jgi:hypothetical protein
MGYLAPVTEASGSASSFGSIRAVSSELPCFPATKKAAMLPCGQRANTSVKGDVPQAGRPLRRTLGAALKREAFIVWPASLTLPANTHLRPFSPSPAVIALAPAVACSPADQSHSGSRSKGWRRVLSAVPPSSRLAVAAIGVFVHGLRSL